MVACLTISAFSLRAALRESPELRGRAVALAPAVGARPFVGPCTRAAEEAGVRPGMRLSEALATCPDLHLVEQDPAAVEAEWELILRRLEEAGLAVEPAEPGCAYFETRGIERLAGGVRAAVQRALDAVGSSWEPRVGVAARRFAALAAASVAPAGRVLLVDDAETELFLEPLPLHLLPLSPERREELSELGVKKLGELSRLSRAAVADRLGAEGADAWQLARGEGDDRVAPRRPPAELAETLEFPETSAGDVCRVAWPCRLVSWGAALGGEPRRCARPPQSPSACDRLSRPSFENCPRRRSSSGSNWGS
jgi:nucleotidyltransferase/DNA polymerase involved in DNA repair